MANLSDFFKDNKKIVVETTLDGILSGALLSKYLDCEIVGYCDDCHIWLSREIMDIESPIYIGRYIANPNVRSIDSHMVALNEQHVELLRKNENKINPNIRLKKYFKNYFYKYPFGLILYLIALFEEEGYEVDLPGITNKYESSGFIIDGWYLLLSSGNTLMNSIDSKYESNISEWIKEIKYISPYGGTTYKLINYINNWRENKDIPGQPIIQFLESFNCEEYHGTQCLGNFSNPVNCFGNLEETFKRIVSLLFKFIDVEENYLSNNLFCHEIRHYPRQTSEYTNLNSFLQFLKEEDVFSYSFDRKPTSLNNLSCSTKEFENKYNFLSIKTKDFISYCSNNKKISSVFDICLSLLIPNNGYTLDFLTIRNQHPLSGYEYIYVDHLIKNYKLYFYKSELSNLQLVEVKNQKNIYLLQKSAYPQTCDISTPKKKSLLREIFGLQSYDTSECSFAYEDGMKIINYIDRDIADYIVPDIWDKIQVHQNFYAVWEAILLNEAKYIYIHPNGSKYEHKDIISDLEDLDFFIDNYGIKNPSLKTFILENYYSYDLLPKIYIPRIRYDRFAIATYYYWQNNKGLVKCEQRIKWENGGNYVKFEDRQEDVIVKIDVVD